MRGHIRPLTQRECHLVLESVGLGRLGGYLPYLGSPGRAYLYGSDKTKPSYVLEAWSSSWSAEKSLGDEWIPLKGSWTDIEGALAAIRQDATSDEGAPCEGRR